MKNYKLLNNILGWFTFAIAAFVYLSTMESTTSLWDCGEFIVSGFKLEVGHPPGAPLFMMIMRIFTLFAPSTEYAAVMANAMSALMSAFTILFLFWSISHLARKLINKKTEDYGISEYIVVFGCAIVGALVYTFSDTFWFSAVEAEVYATSSLITAVVFWAILKWEEVADEKYANRWLVLIAYITGLSIGVHLLNLLAVPAIVFVYYFRKYPVNKWGVVKTSIFAVVLLAFLIWGLIPGIPQMASWFELPFVNDLGLPINSGVLFYIILLAVLLASAIYYTASQKKTYYKISVICIGILGIIILWCVVSSYLAWYAIFIFAIILLGLKLFVDYIHKRKDFKLANTILLCLSMIILGYGSYAMIVVRSSANPPMDQNNPDNIFALLGYLNRVQYGDRPLVYGPYYNAPPVKYTETTSYVLVGDHYEKAGLKQKTEYDPRYTTLFPRMPYTAGLSQDKLSVYKSYTTGKPVPGMTGEQAIVPTFADNLRFLFDYQIGYMYWRYFMWNFAGRQNDLAATKGNPTRGNWLSGIKFIDEARLGPQDNLPLYMSDNKGHNVYYMLPLLLGLLGLAYQLLRDKKNFTVVMLLFFLTGIAIVLYLNQSPNEPRERDYAYAGSFYAFAIWIGLGVMAVYKLLKRFTPGVAAAGIASVASLAVPVIMCEQNWDDHDRSGRYVAADFGYNYLNSCDENGIVFVFGDNDTFPLWYNQEVEENRTDVRVGNCMYLSADWYYEQMMRKVYTSEKFITSATHDKIAGNRRDQIAIIEKTKSPLNAKQELEFMMSDDLKTMVSYGDTKLNQMRSRTLSLPINKQQVINDGLVSESDTAHIPSTLFMTITGNFLFKPNLAIIDIVTNNFLKRPIYFGLTLPTEYQMGLGEHLYLEGLAYKLVPFNAREASSRQLGVQLPQSPITVNVQKTYDLLMNKFRFRGLNDPDVYVDQTTKRMILPYYQRIFFSLAEILNIADQADSLRLLLNKYDEVMPLFYNSFIGYSVNPLVKLYVAAGENEKADKLIKRLCNEYITEIEYFSKIRKLNLNAEDDIYNLRWGIQDLAMMTQLFQGNEEVLKMIEEVIDKYNTLLGR